MNLKDFFIKDLDEYNNINKIIANVFNIENTLPKKAFKENYSNFLFEEFDWAMSDEFWSSIKLLAEKTGDDKIIIGVIEPKPFKYYYKNFDYFNWAIVPVDLNEKKYFEFLELGPENSEADAILYNSTIVFWMPLSLKWAIWGDRNYGTCILAFNKNTDYNSLLPYVNTWKELDDSLGWMALNFKDFKMPENFIDLFKTNYTNHKNND